MRSYLYQIKKGGDELRLQVTIPARKAGLVEEDSDGNQTRLASAYIYEFDGLLVMIDQRINLKHRAEMIATVARDTNSIHGGYPISVAQAGNIYIDGFSMWHSVDIRKRRKRGFVN